ncbi:MAG: hypothetical protein AABW87_01595 [Nanoarchaeota archaeon]
MEFSRIKDERLPDYLRKKHEFALKYKNKIIGYVSFFINNDELIIDNMSVKSPNRNYEEAILINLMHLGLKRGLDKITLLKEIPALANFKVKRSSLPAFTIFIPKEKQKDIKYILEELEAKEKLSEVLEDLPLK